MLLSNSHIQNLIKSKPSQNQFEDISYRASLANRLAKKQPLSTPINIERFFITSEESGIICLFAAILGGRNEILFPYNERELKLRTFLDIAKHYLASRGLNGIECKSEQEARDFIKSEDLSKNWPINVFLSDTVGEKPFEEFFTSNEMLMYNKFYDLASVKFTSEASIEDIKTLKYKILSVNPANPRARQQYLDMIHEFVPTFKYVTADKFLNSRM